MLLQESVYHIYVRDAGGGGGSMARALRVIADEPRSHRLYAVK